MITVYSSLPPFGDMKEIYNNEFDLIHSYLDCLSSHELDLIINEARRMKPLRQAEELATKKREQVIDESVIHTAQK